MRFLDSRAARICTDGNKAVVYGAQVDPRGVWNVTGGCKASDLEAVTPDLFSFVRSLQLTLAGP